VPAAKRPAPEPAAPAARPGSEDAAEPAPAVIGSADEGVAEARRLLAGATEARWPMYLRNAKQILRAGSFDERRYGFMSLMDLLRACQRAGLVRLERDRRGGIRVFPTAALSRETSAAALEAGPAPVPQEPAAPADGGPALFEPDEDLSQQPEETPLTVVDTTAELLGRAKPKRPRAKGGVARPAAKKAAGEAARRAPRRSAKRAAHEASETNLRAD
jgi:hypothetical protein